VEHTASRSYSSPSRETNDRAEDVGGDVDYASCLLAVFNRCRPDSATMHYSRERTKRSQIRGGNLKWIGQWVVMDSTCGDLISARSWCSAWKFSPWSNANALLRINQKMIDQNLLILPKLESRGSLITGIS